MRSRKMLRAAAMLAVLFFVFEPTSAGEPFNTPLGQFEGVTVYSNGSSGYYSGQSNYVGGTYTGVRWQCVEFVRRFYFSAYDTHLSHIGNANSWWDGAPSMGLTQHGNGGVTPPQVGDLIVSNGGGYGHIAVVRSVSPTAVCTASQNFSNTSADVNRCLTLTFSNGNYTVAGFSADYPIHGWMRRPGASCHTGTNPGWSYCTTDCPCDVGEGDCDSNAECVAGLVCKWDTGASYGWDPTMDVCESPSTCSGQAGGWSFCSEYCPCDAGEGDCDSNAECAAGLACIADVGANYGWASTVDVCEVPSTCSTGQNGDWSYCTVSCPCNEGEGDCDTDAECAAGLACIADVGANYGWASSVDVCETPGNNSGGSGGVSGQVAQGGQDLYTLAVNGGQTYTVTMTPTSGDPDLYTHPTSSISTSTWTCRPYLGGTAVESCTFTAPSTRNYYILVRGYTAATYNLTASSP